ncbi:hypothetical protein KC345_g19 [Hortaea werneckii]|nr:hypothetical protein KC345_g19 [Hortaea werneckii]
MPDVILANSPKTVPSSLLAGRISRCGCMTPAIRMIGNTTRRFITTAASGRLPMHHCLLIIAIWPTLQLEVKYA